MAETVLGTAHVYGIAAGTGAITNATVIGFDEDETPVIDEYTEDEDGRRVENRMDDDTRSGSITMRIRSGFTKPSIGDVISFNSENMAIKGIGRAEAGKGYTEVTYRWEINEYIALSS